MEQQNRKSQEYTLSKFMIY